MKLSSTRLIATALLMTFAALPAFAGDAPDSTFPKPQYVPGTYRPSVGLLGGYAEQNGPIHPGIAYGGDFSFQPWVPFGVGIELTHFYAGQDTNSATSFGFYRTALLLKGTYNFGGDIPILRNTYIGGKVGMVFDKEDLTVDTFSLEQERNRFAFAPVIGMDFMVCERWSLGAQFSYLFTVGPETAYNTLNALAAVKYWF